MPTKQIMGNRLRSADGLVRVGPLMAIPDVLSEFGHDPREILAEAGLKLAQFGNPDSEISYLAAGKLLALCEAVTGCDHFGLLVGQRARPSSLGVAGFLLQHAQDVDTALRDLVKHIDLQDQGGIAVLETQRDNTQLGYAIYTPGVEASDQIYDLTMCIACNVMRSLCGESWNPSEVVMPRKTPQDLTPFKRFFRAPLRFNAEQAALIFPSSLLRHRVGSADDLLHSHLEKEATRLHRERGGNIIVEVRMLLRKSMLAGQCTVGNIAEQLCLHERTLNRRLHEQGTTFRREYDNVRFELARQLLLETSMSVAKISTALRYSEASAFNHAFKRWTGETPARWRSRSRAS
jgi:AraC-like DNA-binding protein